MPIYNLYCSDNNNIVFCEIITGQLTTVFIPLVLLLYYWYAYAYLLRLFYWPKKRFYITIEVHRHITVKNIYIF